MYLGSMYNIATWSFFAPNLLGQRVTVFCRNLGTLWPVNPEP